MKGSMLGVLVALLLAALLAWFAWEGFHTLTWRVRYLAPAFFSGVVVGGIVVGLATRR